MIDTAEELVSKFVSEKFGNYNFKLLLGVKHRNKEDLFGVYRNVILNF